MQTKEYRETFESFFEFALGAAVVGAEKLSHFASAAAKSARKYWDEHEEDRAEIRKKLDGYKARFYHKMSDEKKLSFDRIVASLDDLTKEELEKLKAILNDR